MNIKRFIKKHLVTIIGTLVSVVMIAVFCINSGLDSLVETMSSIDPLWLAAAFVSMILYWVFEALALHTLVRRFNTKRTFRRTLKVAMIGQLYNAITPFASGGQPMQVYEMTVNDGMCAGEASAIIARRSLIFQCGFTTFALLSIAYAFTFFSENITGFGLVTLLGIGLNLLYLIGLLVLSKSRRLTMGFTNVLVKVLTKLRIVKNPQKIHDKVDGQIEMFHKSSGMFADSLPSQLVSFFITFMQLAFYFLVPYCIYRCFGLAGASVAMIVAAGAYVYMISAFMPLPGGSGAAEGSFYMLFALFFNSASIASGMLLWRAITYYACFIAGALSMMLTNKKNKTITADSAEA